MLDLAALLDKARPGGREPIVNDEWEEYEKAFGYDTIVALLDRIAELEAEIEGAHKVLDDHISREGVNGNPYYLWGRIAAAFME